MEAPDLHNFGQSVQKIGRGSENFYQKPRPIYWEWLFFGRNSPLSIFFEHSRVEGISPQQVIFNLATEISASYCGSSAEIVGKPDAKSLSSHSYSLGVLLAYCYVFGIRDLHRHNLVKTETHLQVVDAEVVLSKLILPHETLLLPFKEVGAGLCGAHTILDLTDRISSETVALIFNGYMDVFDCVIGQLDPIKSAFETRSEITTIPIRHILRDTFHYRAWNKSEPVIPFFESEISQLKRGDIPYYFKFMGCSEVFEYTDKYGSFSPVALPDAFLKGAAREAQIPGVLLDDKRLRVQLLGPGLLYLAKTFLPIAPVPSVQGEGYHIMLSEQEVRASTAFGDFAAPRT
jgi:hypothetical protein